MKKIAFLLLVISAMAFTLRKGEEINWLTFDDAQTQNKKKSKKTIIDVYTDWCGWCKKLDASTYKNKEIVKYTNEKYYAIKFNAEGKEAIKFNETNYAPTAGTHKLASYLLSNKLSYPTTVILDEDWSVIQSIPGYMDAKTMEMVLHYFAEDAYKTIPWDDYQKTFSGEVK